MKLKKKNKQKTTSQHITRMGSDKKERAHPFRIRGELTCISLPGLQAAGSTTRYALKRKKKNVTHATTAEERRRQPRAPALRPAGGQVAPAAGAHPPQALAAQAGPPGSGPRPRPRTGWRRGTQPGRIWRG